MSLDDPALEPSAPTSDPKIAARAVTVPRLKDNIWTVIISYSARSEQSPTLDKLHALRIVPRGRNRMQFRLLKVIRVWISHS
jgi:hypothetical protein